MVVKNEELSAHFGKKRAFKASVLISLVINFILIMGILYGRNRNIMNEENINWIVFLKYFLWHFCCSVLLFYLLFVFNFRIQKTKKPPKTYFFAGIGTILICIIISPILAQFQWYLLVGNSGLSDNTFITFNMIKDVVAGVIVIIFTHSIYLNYKREQTLTLNQKLIEENMRSRYEALKNQVEPHFLFNSLNTLNGLIGFDDDKAHEYVDNLSSVFRYTLHSKSIQTLDKEIEFVNSYLELLKIRYGDNLKVHFDIDNKYRDYYVIPASIQMLVENAVKHNVISNKDPLTICIYNTINESIIVSNPVKPKSGNNIGGGIGLANLTDRYDILFKKMINIKESDGVFSVEIPLIKEFDKLNLL